MDINGAVQKVNGLYANLKEIEWNASEGNVSEQKNRQSTAFYRTSIKRISEAYAGDETSTAHGIEGLVADLDYFYEDSIHSIAKLIE